MCRGCPELYRVCPECAGGVLNVPGVRNVQGVS